MMRSQRHMPVVAMFMPLAALAFAAPAAAQQAAPASEPAITESKPAEKWIPKLRAGTDESYIEVYGQIDKGVLIFDDGGSTLGYAPVDNGNSTTRGGIRAYAALNEIWSIGGNVEAEWNPYATTNVDQLNRDDFDWDTWQPRKAEVYAESKNLGKLWLGQGSMASDLTAEYDLSGTSVVGYSQLGDMAGGPFFRFADGELTSVRVKD
ncbi:MAG TPA: porin, partial [Mesorhizobium sp.]|nr:porin [Mesorhizobium sp.]